MKGMMTMKRILKRAAAAVLALAMCAGLAGCYSEDKAWSAKLGDDTMPIGGYIYYLTSAYSEAAEKISSENSVLGSSIDGQGAEEWLRNRAVDYLYSYYFVEQKFNELGLSFDEEEQEAVQTSVNTMWSYSKAAFEGLGIAESSFEKAYGLYNQRLSLLLPAMYGKGGELEIPQADVKDYYVNGYTYYQYFSVPLTKTGEEGSSVELTEDEKATEKQMLEDWVELFNKGRLTYDEMMSNYSSSHDGQEPTAGEPVAVANDSLSDLFTNALTPLENGQAAVIDASSRYYVVVKLDIEEDYAALAADEERTANLLRAMRGEEFLEYTMEQGRNLGVELNQKAIAAVRLSALAEAMGEKGVSSASLEESSSSSSSSSEAEESSDTSSEDSASEESSEEE